jgi:hypothetical protein
MIKHSGNAKTGLPENRETGMGPKFKIRYVLTLNYPKPTKIALKLTLN